MHRGAWQVIWSSLFGKMRAQSRVNLSPLLMQEPSQRSTPGAVICKIFHSGCWEQYCSRPCVSSSIIPPDLFRQSFLSLEYFPHICADQTSTENSRESPEGSACFCRQLFFLWDSVLQNVAALASLDSQWCLCNPRKSLECVSLGATWKLSPGSNLEQSKGSSPHLFLISRLIGLCYLIPNFLPEVQSPAFDPWVGKIPQRGTAPHASTLAWRIPRPEGPPCQATGHGVAKSQTGPREFHFTYFPKQTGIFLSDK